MSSYIVYVLCFLGGFVVGGIVIGGYLAASAIIDFLGRFRG